LAQAGLFGWMTAEDRETPQPHLPQTLPQRISDRVSSLTGHQERTLFPYLLVLAILVAPFAGWRDFRIVLFALIAMAVAWVQMVINKDTGGAIHHTILLWPLPQLVVAISLAGISLRLGRFGRPAVAGLTAVVALSSVLVINEYYVKAWKNGGAPFWTDAILTLSQYFKENRPPSWVIATDWSISDQIRLLHRGRIPVGAGTDQVNKPEMTAEDREVLARMLSHPDFIWVAHTRPYEIFQGADAKVLQFATAAGYRKEPITSISDSYGRPVYELYRFTK
jgi:hypothetical protein